MYITRPYSYPTGYLRHSTTQTQHFIAFGTGKSATSASKQRQEPAAAESFSLLNKSNDSEDSRSEVQDAPNFLSKLTSYKRKHASGLSTSKNWKKYVSLRQKGLESNIDRIRFYRRQDPYFVLGNFSRTPVELDGKQWPTSEHYYQAQKYTEHPELQAEIRRTRSPMTVYHLAHKHPNEVRSDWEQVKDDVMHKVVLAKFRQNEEARLTLLSTGILRLEENSPTDAYWGIGQDGKGKNRLGAILEVVREQLKQEFPGYKAEIANKERFIPVANRKDCYLISPYPRALQPLIEKLKSAQEGSDVYPILRKATQKIPGFQNSGQNHYTYQGFTFLDTTKLNRASSLEALKRARNLNLKSVPRLVEEIEIDPYYCLIVTEIPHLASKQRLIPYQGNEDQISVSAKQDFLHEMEQLALPYQDGSGSQQPGLYIPALQNGSNTLMIQPDEGKLILPSMDTALPIAENQSRQTIVSQFKKSVHGGVVN